MRLPVDVSVGPKEDAEGFQPETEFIVKLRNRLNLAHELARKSIKSSQGTSKQHYDRNLKGCKIEVGDLVLWYTPQVSENEISKLHRDWSVPYRVVTKLSEQTFRIQKVGSNLQRDRKIVHYDRLRLFQKYDGGEKSSVVPAVKKKKSPNYISKVPVAAAVTPIVRSVPEPMRVQTDVGRTDSQPLKIEILDDEEEFEWQQPWEVERAEVMVKREAREEEVEENGEIEEENAEREIDYESDRSSEQNDEQPDGNVVEEDAAVGADSDDGSVTGEDDAVEIKGEQEERQDVAEVNEEVLSDESEEREDELVNEVRRSTRERKAPDRYGNWARGLRWFGNILNFRW
jgi:hypothetical protein